ncbi:citrate synthase [Sediminitomix flava]|uniref:Citrate synthase n=1 Tax=Sediminitomix flava TaxID=379075 RepID=A0A315Z9C7_SEDFL|nr:citrate synthase [Sediminitomix flava]PWJ42165.1 citrate synthase [Sediminitomix flava]
MNKTAQLQYDGNTYEIPVLEGSEGEKALDISKLRATSGLITLDVGFKNTGSTTSNVTFLDGEKGILRHRGYSIEDLAEKSSFLEVAYLLIYGELPDAQTFENWSSRIMKHSLVHEDIRKIFDGFPSTAHPMGVLSSLVTSLTAFHPESIDPNRDSAAIDLTIVRLLAKLPTLAAWSFKNSQGLPLEYPNAKNDYVSNFMQMMFKNKHMDYDVDPVIMDAMNKLLILHADHEQNCSAATVRVVGSSLSSLYVAVSAGINALWGSLHGGANQAVIEMLETIQADGGNIDKFIAKAKDKNDPFRLMGFGHRVYKNFDPRSRIIKKAADDILDRLGVNDPLLDIAKKLEDIALTDPYFVEKKLYPNVDFYSGIIYKALGFPTEMFTVLFALGRLPGWIAQWKESREMVQPISRPRQVYTGETHRAYPEDRTVAKETVIA